VGYAAGIYNFVDREALIVGAGISRFQTWHMDLDEYDNTETAFKLFGRYIATPFAYGLQLVPSIYQLDDEDFLLTTQFKPDISYTINKQASMWLSYTYSINDYRQSDYDERDDSSHELFLDTVYLLKEEKGYLVGGIGYESNTASDDTYDYSRYTLRAGGSFEMAYDLSFDVMGTYAGKAYKNDDPLEGNKRDDTRYNISLSLSRKLYYEWLEFSAELSYAQNNSNISDYEYTRQIVGVGLTAVY